jgi:hypothetical protein
MALRVGLRLRLPKLAEQDGDEKSTVSWREW